MSEKNYHDVIVRGEIPEMSNEDFDALIDYLCSEEIRDKDLGLEQYQNLSILLQEHWWLAETAISQLMKTSKHNTNLRKHFKGTQHRDPYARLVDRIVDTIDRRMRRFQDWKQDPREPDYDKAKADLSEAT